MRTIVRGLSACTLAGLAAPLWADDSSSNQYTLEIERQPIVAALTEFSRQTGLQVGYLPRNEQEESTIVAELKGQYTAESALQELLAPSELSFERVNDTTLAVMAPRSAFERLAFRLTGGGSWQRIRLAQAQTLAGAERPSQEVSESSSVSRKKSDPLEEVIVTAQRRQENIKEIPMSITAVSNEQLQAARITNTLDLSFAVPGLAVAETGPGRQIIVIRGLGSERGSSSLTGIYLDDIPVSGAQDGFIQSYIDLRTTDLERVEVLKGPQGTLFGEGSVGGTLRFITKDPELRGFGGSFNTSFYSTSDGGESGEVVAIANLPLVEDVFALRVAGTYENKAGWIDRPSIGKQDINDNELYNVRVKGLWAPTAELRVMGTAVVHRSDGGASNIVNQGSPEDSLFLQAFNPSAPTDFEDEYEIYNLTGTYDFGFAELLSSTSRVTSDSVQSMTQLLGDPPVPWLQILHNDYAQHAEITSQEFRLTSSGEGRFNWTIGAFYKEAEMTQEYETGVSYINTRFGFFGQGVLAGEMPTNKSDSLAEYVDVSYALTERFKVGGGLRYFYDKREAFDRSDISGTFLEDNFDALTFRAYGSFFIADGVHAYVTVGDGFRSGGFNPSPTERRLGAPQSYDPESIVSYELGIKTVSYDGRLGFDAALFYSEYEDMQDDVVRVSTVDPNKAIQFTANDQRAELKGVEWDLSWKATDSLSLSLAGEVLDTEITKASSASPFDVGDPINFVPDYRVTATANYQFDWAATMPGFLRIDFNRQGKSFNTARRGIANEQSVAPEVDFLNISIGAELNDWQFTVFGRNLTDERGIIRAGASGMTSQARPRSVGLSAGKRF